MTIEECLRRVAERSPELKSGSYKTEAAERRARQAARPINPRLETEIENVAGSGAVEGVDAAETTVAVSQEIELGGKRRHRTAVAEAETAVTRAEREVRLRAALFETRRAALAVQSAQEKARLADEALTLIRETESVAVAREKAGKTTVLETERARAETAKAEIELEARRAEQRDAVRELALFWGETEPTFDAVDGPFDAAAGALPPLDDLLVRAASNPDLLAAEAQTRTFEARIGAERAARVPNLELSAGVRRFEEGGDFGFVAGAGIELPFYTRNMDGVRAAEADAEAARLEATAARLRNEGRVRQLYARLDTLGAKTVRLKGTVMPVTERTLALVRDAHKQGKAGYLDVLEARRTLVEARSQLIETVSEYLGVSIELGRLTNTLSDNL
ncbi:MAG: TolC family protein [Kiritimatiellae bacterium]|nr:TolC family protein [Kiritimatiellia bacterium]MDD4442811.1 TolC family protein [Kiritimatiellia bacterium]